MIAEIILDSLRFLHHKKRLRLHAFVLMENHLHMIASSPDLSREIRNFKSFTARKCIDWYQLHHKSWVLHQLQLHKNDYKTDQQHQFWQEGFHPKLIKDDAMLLNKLEYIHHNPLKRGYVDDPGHWRYSSYRNYMEQESVLPIEILT